MHRGKSMSDRDQKAQEADVQPLTISDSISCAEQQLQLDDLGLKGNDKLLWLLVYLFDEFPLLEPNLSFFPSQFYFSMLHHPVQTRTFSRNQNLGSHQPLARQPNSPQDSERNPTEWSLSLPTSSNMSSLSGFYYDMRMLVDREMELMEEISRRRHIGWMRALNSIPERIRSAPFTGSTPTYCPPISTPAMNPTFMPQLFPQATAPTSISALSGQVARQFACTRNSDPVSGSTYIIVESSTRKALAFCSGFSSLDDDHRVVLTLAAVPGLSFDSDTSDFARVQTVTFTGACPWLWHCKESKGWLAFQNDKTREYLGQPYTGRCLHRCGHPKKITSSGRFCVAKEQGSGNYMLFKEFKAEGEERGVRESIEFRRYDRNGKRVVDERIAGTNAERPYTTWEFVKVTVAPQTNPHVPNMQGNAESTRGYHGHAAHARCRGTARNR